MIKIIEETIHFFKSNFYAISLLTLIIEFPFIIIRYIEVLGRIPDIIALWIAIIVIVYFFVVVPFSIGAQTHLYYQIINGIEQNLSECLSVSKKNLSSLVIASFFFFILLFGGLVLFIIPGIIIGVRLSFFPFLVLFESYKPLPALRESFMATKAYVWNMMIPIIILNLLILVPDLILSMLLNDKGVLIFFLYIFLDSIFAILGWLPLIVAFRFYCLYRKNGELN